MNKKQAQLLAEIIGGEAWLKNDTWAVSIIRSDGSVVMIADDSVKVFVSDDALDSGIEANRVDFSIGNGDEGFWIVQDDSGKIYYRNAEIEAGWRWREEAEEHSLAVQSRTGANCEVRRLSTASRSYEN